MTRLEIILSSILFLSVCFNACVFVYARAAISRLLFVSEELGDLQNMIDAMAKHLKSVYELEMFYGDVTLEHLLNHAVSFNEQLETFEHIYSLTEEEAPIDHLNEDEEFDSNEEDTPPQSED